MPDAKKIAGISQTGTAFFNSVLRVFQTPFPGLPIVMWAYFVLAFIVLPSEPLWHGLLPDPDDYTYLTQTIDWLKGQGWYDNIQHRMSPSEGTFIHYTRFAQIPIAAFILIFRLFDNSWQNAALYASFCIPLLYFGLFLWVLKKTAEQFSSAEWSGLTAVFAVFASSFIYKFIPGEVDHHSLIFILTIVGLGLTTRMFRNPDQWLWPFTAGGVLAFSVVISLEGLPWEILISSGVGLWSAKSGAKTAKSASIFGFSLFATSLLFLAFYRPMSIILNPDFLSYSIVYVILAGGLALVLFAVSALSHFKTIRIRLIVFGTIVFLIAIYYFFKFPAMLNGGPFGSFDKRLMALFELETIEMMPMISRNPPLITLCYIFVPMLCFCFSVFRTLNEKGHKIWNWALLSFLLAISLILGLFFQSRIWGFASIFSIISLPAFIQKGYGWISKRFDGRRRVFVLTGLVLSVGPLPLVFLPALIDSRLAGSSVVTYFLDRDYKAICDVDNVVNVLNKPPYSQHKQRIMNMMYEGAQILFYTPHEVMAAPYHMNIRGNLDAVDFFSTTDSENAREIVKRDGIDYVLACHSVYKMYTLDMDAFYHSAPDGRIVKTLRDGSEVNLSNDESFIWQLAAGKIPAWLRPMPVSGATGYSLYEVVGLSK